MKEVIVYQDKSSFKERFTVDLSKHLKSAEENDDIIADRLQQTALQLMSYDARGKNRSF